MNSKTKQFRKCRIKGCKKDADFNEYCTQHWNFIAFGNDKKINKI